MSEPAIDRPEGKVRVNIDQSPSGLDGWGERGLPFLWKLGVSPNSDSAGGAATLFELERRAIIQSVGFAPSLHFRGRFLFLRIAFHCRFRRQFPIRHIAFRPMVVITVHFRPRPLWIRPGRSLRSGDPLSYGAPPSHSES